MIGAVLFDVDDVLVEMDQATHRAEQAVVAPLARRLPLAVAQAVQAGLTGGYAVLRAQLRAPPGTVHPEYRALRARIDGWQRGVVEGGHEVKQWSRDTLLAVALEDAGAPVEAELLESAAQAYWGTMATESALFPDARALLSELAERGVPFHLATNSDGFLRFDPGARTFRYDPEDARRRKLQRARALADFGLGPERITVGDPLGKPDPRFFQRAVADLEAALGRAVDRRGLLAVGDSLSNDVLPVLAIGAGQGALLERARLPAGPEPHPVERGVWVVRSLSELRPLIWGTAG